MRLGEGGDRGPQHDHDRRRRDEDDPASTGGHSSCARICRWLTASRAPSVGGATSAAPPAARPSTAHSTSSKSRRTVPARARSIRAPAISGATTGRRLRVRSHVRRDPGAGAPGRSMGRVAPGGTMSAGAAWGEGSAGIVDEVGSRRRIGEIPPGVKPRVQNEACGRDQPARGPLWGEKTESRSTPPYGLAIQVQVRRSTERSRSEQHLPATSSEACSENRQSQRAVTPSEAQPGGRRRTG